MNDVEVDTRILVVQNLLFAKQNISSTCPDDKDFYSKCLRQDVASMVKRNLSKLKLCNLHDWKAVPLSTSCQNVFTHSDGSRPCLSDESTDLFLSAVIGGKNMV